MAQRGCELRITCPDPEASSRSVGGVAVVSQRHVAVSDGGSFTPTFAAALAQGRAQRVLLDVGEGSLGPVQRARVAQRCH
eukprot:7976515-Alexandrium_andersonii.AAC.1